MDRLSKRRKDFTCILKNYAHLCCPRCEPITPDLAAGPVLRETGAMLGFSGLDKTLISGPNFGGSTNPDLSVSPAVNRNKTNS